MGSQLAPCPVTEYGKGTSKRTDGELHGGHGGVVGGVGMADEHDIGFGFENREIRGVFQAGAGAFVELVWARGKLFLARYGWTVGDEVERCFDRDDEVMGGGTSLPRKHEGAEGGIANERHGFVGSRRHRQGGGGRPWLHDGGSVAGALGGDERQGATSWGVCRRITFD